MSLKTFLDSETNIVKSPPKVINNGNNNEMYREKLIMETQKLAVGEPNYFNLITSISFILRLILVLGLTAGVIIIVLNATLDNDPDTYFNKLYKPDWAPDGVIISVITGFFSFVYAWIWYDVCSKITGKYAFLMNLLFIGVYVLIFLWAYYFFNQNNIETARWISYFIVGGFTVIFIITAWKLKMFSPSVLLVLNLAWWITIMFYSIQSKELSKEFKILGLVKEDMSSNLYRQKLKLEMAYGIKITPEGEKIEFNPDDQE